MTAPCSTGSVGRCGPSSQVRKLRQGRVIWTWREAIGNHRDPKQEPRQQQREKMLRIPKLQQFSLPEESRSRLPGARLLHGGRERPAVAETLVSLRHQSTRPNTCFRWHLGCTKIMQVALVFFLPLLERIQNSLFSPFY